MNESLNPRISVRLDAEKKQIQLVLEDEHVAGTWMLDSDEYRTLSADDLERQIGASILAVLSGLVGFSIGNRDYLMRYSRHTAAMMKRLKEELSEGNEVAIVYIVQQYLSTARLRHDHHSVNEAEVQLRAAAAAGNKEAIGYLSNQWPTEKRMVLAELANGSRNSGEQPD